MRTVRERLGLSQPVFARALNVSLGTVRGWEQGARRPDGPTQRLLEVAERHPEAVLEIAALTRGIAIDHDAPIEGAIPL